MCTQWGFKSAWVFAQSDQRVHCAHEETLHPWLSKMHPVKILSDCPNAQANLNIRGWHVSESTFSGVELMCIVHVCMLFVWCLFLADTSSSLSFFQVDHRPSKYITSFGRRRDVMTSRRRLNDVVCLMGLVLWMKCLSGALNLVQWCLYFKHTF